MKTILTGLAGLVCVCLISQAASGFEPKIPLSNTSLVILSDCDYLVKNCGNSQVTVKQTKGYEIKLKESLTMDSSDKKKDTKPTKETKQTKTKEKKSDTKKAKDLKKKFEKVKEKLKVKKKPITSSKQSTQKTKHDTAKNSIGNIR